MTFTKLYQNYFNLLWESFQYDIEVFSQWWMYTHLLIPATFYLVFFIVKWIVLTFPIWFSVSLPLKLLNGMANIMINYRNNHIKKTLIKGPKK